MKRNDARHSVAIGPPSCTRKRTAMVSPREPRPQGARRGDVAVAQCDAARGDGVAGRGDERAERFVKELVDDARGVVRTRRQ